MKRNWYILIFLLLAGCYGGNEELLKDEEEINELQESVSCSINLESNFCKVCNAFNKAYVYYSSRMKEGYSNYKEKKGCCKDCFLADFDKFYNLIGNMYSDRIIAQIRNIEHNGPMYCPLCESYVDIMNPIIAALNKWPLDVSGAVMNAVNIAGERKCKNWKEPSEIDPPIGGGGSMVESLPLIAETYEKALTRTTQELLEEIGGDVEINWVRFKFDEYLLRICYAFHQSIDPIGPDKVAHVSGQIDSKGDYYLVSFKALYNYLSEAYFEPELLTISELQAKGNKYHAIVIEKSVATLPSDEDIFGDLWNGRRFVSDRTTSLTEFYCWTCN